MANFCPLGISAAAYLIGILDEAERVDFERHIRFCRSCRQEVDDLTPVVQLLQAMKVDNTAKKRARPGRSP
ncbi:zf-HC2 domain-containing protein [Amycolatopsis roodepoortensis]|uniref:zf-HC2 domain-containing protein n=1 Tax=Amycolatopsis roodepoortensis TaxID=700274 RepID=UPI00214C0CC7|nr:zf-HC2 domain-containing protein [Amycolatopsis roodepoortensis]UUV29958.1 zf-HC2 domain-containing protein [Amycolatopsis roodepoortensis]